MDKAIYCVGRSSGKKISLPVSLVRVFKVKDIFKQDFSLVILDEEFLRKITKISKSYFKDKICLIHFRKKSKDNTRIAKKFGFFDYFTDEDPKSDILFKLDRAKKTAEVHNRLGNLTSKISQKKKKIEDISLVDPLTDCYNWRYFLNRTQQEISSSLRHSHSISFIGIDVDHFRQINEIYGVAVGDFTTKELAKILKNSLRKEDIITRWRQDEFFIIAPHTGGKHGYDLAQRLKDKITNHKFKFRKVIIRLHCSIGVVFFPNNNISNPNDVVNAFDRCFNLAKRKGGDTIILHSQIKQKHLPRKNTIKVQDKLKEKIDGINKLMTRDLLEMIYGFARAIEASDHYTGRHVEYTATLAEQIAVNLKLPPKEVENIKHAAVLHDLGKVGIDRNILLKKGALTKKEREIIKTHPSIGASILREIHALRWVVPAVLYHHERFDGKGYPLGLRGEEIPLSARIVAVADVFQALTSDRPYRKGFSKTKAIQIVKEESGKQFDPKIVEAFLKAVKKINGKR